MYIPIAALLILHVEVLIIKVPIFSCNILQCKLLSEIAFLRKTNAKDIILEDMEMDQKVST